MQINPDAKVFACVDGSPFTNAVSDYAAWAAKRLGVRTTLLHTIEERPDPVFDLSGSIGLGAREQLMDELVSLEEKRSRLLLEAGQSLLNRSSERIIAAGCQPPIKVQRMGNLLETLIDCEDEIRVLFMGISGQQSEERDQRIGAHLESVVRSLYKPIFVVNREFKEPSRIMLAFDGSEGSFKALKMLTDRPLLTGLACHLVNVNQSARFKNTNEQAAKQLEAAGFNVTVAELDGTPQEALCHYQRQKQIDLTVMGAFTHTRIRDMLIGSFTVKMLLSTDQPLLLLR
jgi:nucleotide-binding universal stress UspA family protein